MPTMTLESYESTFFLALRRMRTPLITLILIYAVSVLGLTLAPGTPDDQGNPVMIGFFHAFYIITYTATTIGFGEVPIAFSEAQRGWITFCIYLLVFGWTYLLGTFLALLQDKNFRNAVRLQRFGWTVQHMREPFYIVCGYGETGQLICQALDQMGLRVVVIEISETKLSQLDLHGYVADMPALAADARQPEVLKLAGLTNSYCKGIIALTDDDSANLAIAISVRLLAPEATALCRAETNETATNMESFGTRHIINPFAKFGRYLALALGAPAAYYLLEWLTAVPGTLVERHRDPPRGHWILCGYGRFGKAMVLAMEEEGVDVTVIDHEPPPNDNKRHWVRGDGTGASALLEAGINDAAGIIASTCDDINNLSIAVTARKLQPDMFIVLRQNLNANQALFSAFEADIKVIPSQIVIRECLAILTTPLLEPFLRQIKQRGESWASTLLEQLNTQFGKRVAPTVWSVHINQDEAPTLLNLPNGNKLKVPLKEILRDPYNRSKQLKCRVLYMTRKNGSAMMLPYPQTQIQEGDHLLFVGDSSTRHALEFTLKNENTIEYVLNGQEAPGGWVWEKIGQLHTKWTATATATATATSNPSPPDQLGIDKHT